MHTIEPFIKWNKFYMSSEDKNSPFFGKTYNNDLYSQKVYNYFIHSEWDDMGSSTLYAKIIFVDYEESYAFIELIGEWNDCLYNDVMYLKRNIVDNLVFHKVFNIFIFCEHVFNFHSSDNSYYEEWWDDVKDDNGNIIFLNTRKHIWEEMQSVQIQYYAHFGEDYNDFEWQNKTPKMVYQEILEMQNSLTKQLN